MFHVPVNHDPMTVLLTGVGATRSVRCEPPYSRTMGRHFVIVLVPFVYISHALDATM
jgi:hypothetical protein